MKKTVARKAFVLYSTVIAALLFTNCKDTKKDEPEGQKVIVEKTVTFTTPLDKEIVIAKPSEKLLVQYEEAKEKYNSNPTNVEALIWYGRRTAYLGRYNDAIAIYSEGIKNTLRNHDCIDIGDIGISPYANSRKRFLIWKKRAN